MIENTIFANLVYNEEFNKSALPHIKTNFFKQQDHQVTFDLITDFVTKYGKQPTKEALLVELSDTSGFPEEVVNDTAKFIESLERDKDTDITWLNDQTEKYCQDAAIYNAIMDSIAIIDGSDEKQEKGAIPELLADALSVSFNTSVGHDYADGIDERFAHYHNKEAKMPFDLEYFNKVTGGGIKNKTLTVALAGTGVGKSMFMCHMAAHNLMMNKNVLYISMEMDEFEVAQRIDANLLDVRIDQIVDLTKDRYMEKHAKLKTKHNGRLKIKEYPAGSANVLHFKSLLRELKIKDRFIPDVIYVDYINICSSARITMAGGSYGYIKAIAEELRGMAQEYNVPVITATQLNRDGFDSSDVSLTNTAESFGLPATADFMFALMQSPELEEQGLIEVKQLKNRGNDVSYFRRFVVGVNKAKMNFHDVAQSDNTSNTEDAGHQDDKPVFDSSGYGIRADEEEKMKWATKKKGRKDFSALK